MKLNYKIWLENEQGERVMGKGLLALLSFIDQTGSINKAAKELEMSYRAAWGKLNKAEEELGYDLIERRSGGRGGGGSRLTEKGNNLLDKFNKFSKKVDQELNIMFLDFFDR
ncbi:LysR family transcriptional regulator [Natroniella sulfidigena]|uniref:winged helix-turn-helix domain-containing protein n=1 Tax=Natroniella sulfidigena TaxID=723921 RepID=UPI00200B4BC2|nr:LysR family transcriptional regulator [Natroniella sulfidigena]MCK8817358.1 LysR family transcriptional regulator [Natroniella sulfidigena]